MVPSSFRDEAGSLLLACSLSPSWSARRAATLRFFSSSSFSGNNSLICLRAKIKSFSSKHSLTPETLSSLGKSSASRFGSR